MTRNMSSTDRMARATIGLAVLGGFFTMGAPWRWLGLIGLVPLVTALIGWCPAYALLGFSTEGVGPKHPA